MATEANILPLTFCIPRPDPEFQDGGAQAGVSAEPCVTYNGTSFEPQYAYILDSDGATEGAVGNAITGANGGFEFMNLTIEQGGLVGGAILAVWAVSWCIRLLAHHLKTLDEENYER